MFEFILIQPEAEDNAQYGIRINKEGKPYRTYPEIADNRTDAERLLKRIADGRLSALHFDDVVTDYLLELAYLRIERNGL